MVKILASEITPEHVYVSRRKFLSGLGAAFAGAAFLAACGPQGAVSTPEPTLTGAQTPGPTVSSPADELTSEQAVTSLNNYYEFTVDQSGVAGIAKDFRVSPWSVEVGGLVGKPRSFDVDDLVSLGQEERIYRMRCVEAWSMVIPWVGFPLSRLLELVEPASSARYVRFVTLLDPEQMPGQKSSSYPWPYVEGLRLDEALHDLTILATGLYGKPLLPQNGAPVRLVVPWKYGFKSIKSIVRIDLVEEMPTSLWMTISPNEYGFWANVNPKVPHPRWSQATERRIGEGGRRETLFFNGYADEVASLYPDLDNREWYY